MPVDGARYRLPAGQYEVFAYRSTKADRVEITHSKHNNAANIISRTSGGVTTWDGVEWIEIKGADRAIIMPTNQLDKRTPPTSPQ